MPTRDRFGDKRSIDPERWLNAIRSLVRDGLVVMQGSKRGERYTLPAPPASDAELFAEMKA